MVIIGNHEYHMQFTMPIWEKYEKKFGIVEDFDVIVTRPGRLRKICEMAALMSVEQPLSDEMLFREMEPSDVRKLVDELRRAIREGLKMEVEEGEDEVVDEVLEEIQKKETGAR